MRPFDPTRRDFLASAGVLLLPAGLRSADAPADDPLAGYKLEWTGQVKWANVVDVTRMKGDTADERLTAAQAVVAAKGGGVAYFPPGVHRFKDSIKLLDNIGAAYRRGRHPDSRVAGNAAKVLRALADELEL